MGFAILFVQSTADYLETQSEEISAEYLQDISELFGSVQTGIISLFMASTGGIDWIIIHRLLQPVGPFYSVSFILFILFLEISVWNIVTSIFIHKAAKLAGREETSHVQEKEKQI